MRFYRKEGDFMTERQKRFCDFYIQTGNGTEAAIKAGYSEKTARFIANENLTKPYIRHYIDEQLQKLEDERIADTQEVLKYLTSVMRGEHKEEVVVVEGYGEGCSGAKIVDKEVGAKDRLKAAELLGKRYGLFTDKVNVEGNTKVVIVDDLET